MELFFTWGLSLWFHLQMDICMSHLTQRVEKGCLQVTELVILLVTFLLCGCLTAWGMGWPFYAMSVRRKATLSEFTCRVRTDFSPLPTLELSFACSEAEQEAALSCTREGEISVCVKLRQSISNTGEWWVKRVSVSICTQICHVTLWILLTQKLFFRWWYHRIVVWFL